MKKFFSKWFSFNIIHILAWAVFIIYETIVAGLAFGLWAHPLTYIVHYLINIGFFYAFGIYLFPWSLKDKRHAVWKLFFAVLGGMVVFLFLNLTSDLILMKYQIIQNRNEEVIEAKHITKVLYRGVYFLIYSFAYYLLVSYLNTRKLAEESEKHRLNGIIAKEKMKRQLSRAHNMYLKAQINPHFLFNTLDYIYHQVRGLSMEAGDAIISLSEMMRYAIDADQDEATILLGDEIEQVEKLLGLFQLRQNHGLNIEVYFSESVYALKFIPLVLITLTENMFKHGNLLDTETGALVAVYVDEDFLYIKTRNKINLSQAQSRSRKGLLNTKERLSYAYGEHVTFEFGETSSGIFETMVRLQLTALEKLQDIVVEEIDIKMSSSVNFNA